MRSPTVLASAALVVLTLACQDQPTSPDVAPLFAPGGQGPPSPIQMSVSAGRFHSCGVTRAGAAHCWGQGANGRLGDGTNTDSNVPVGVDPPF